MTYNQANVDQLPKPVPGLTQSLTTSLMANCKVNDNSAQTLATRIEYTQLASSPYNHQSFEQSTAYDRTSNTSSDIAVTTTPVSEMTHQQRPQVDGSSDHNSIMAAPHFRTPQDAQRHFTNSANPQLKKQTPAAANVPMDLLPYCTTNMRLSNEQIIALSDVAGNWREIVLLSLAAAADESARADMERAIGREAAAGVVDFWGDEWVAE